MVLAAMLALTASPASLSPAATLTLTLTHAEASAPSSSSAPFLFAHAREIDEDEHDEFVFDDDESATTAAPSAPAPASAPAAASASATAVDDDDDVADLLADEDEFVGAETPSKTAKPALKQSKQKAGGGKKGKGKEKKAPAASSPSSSEATIGNVLASPQSFFQPFGVAEYAALALVALWIAGWITGRATNSGIARRFEQHFRSIVAEQFALVDEGELFPSDSDWKLSKESDSQYRLYATGRRNCSGMLLTLDLQRRQDLVSRLLALVDLAPNKDTMVRFGMRHTRCAA